MCLRRRLCPQMDLLEHAAVADVIVPSVVLEEVKARNASAYQRLRQLVAADAKRFFVFANEHHRQAPQPRLQAWPPSPQRSPLAALPAAPPPGPGLHSRGAARRAAPLLPARPCCHAWLPGGRVAGWAGAGGAGPGPRCSLVLAPSDRGPLGWHPSQGDVREAGARGDA